MVVPARSVKVMPGSAPAAVGGQIYYRVVEEMDTVPLPQEFMLGSVDVDKLRANSMFSCKPERRG